MSTLFGKLIFSRPIYELRHCPINKASSDIKLIQQLLYEFTYVNRKTSQPHCQHCDKVVLEAVNIAVNIWQGEMYSYQTYGHMTCLEHKKLPCKCHGLFSEYFKDQEARKTIPKVMIKCDSQQCTWIDPFSMLYSKTCQAVAAEKAVA